MTMHMKKNRTQGQKGATQLGFPRTETNPRQVEIYVAQEERPGKPEIKPSREHLSFIRKLKSLCVRAQSMTTNL